MPTPVRIAETMRSLPDASVALENERLRTELRARRVELRVCREQALDTADAVRRRLERDLHDGLQQRLVSAAMTLGLLEAKLPGEPEAAKPIARDARDAIMAALQELRAFSNGLYPAALAERGLAAALEELADRATLPAYLDLSCDLRLPADVEAAAYFVASEAVTNAVKHAHAREVRIAARCKREQLVVEVGDDGIGTADPENGSGLRGLTDRVRALGGRLLVSSRPGRGTVIRAELPCV
jgi:signal transduction histidine kinase